MRKALTFRAAGSSPAAGRWWPCLAALAAVAAITTGCGFSLQSFPKFGGQGGASYPLHATFANVLNLPANAQVRDGSAVIGEVSSISTKNFQADLTLKIRQGIHLPVGTTAQVRFDSPLGDEFVLVATPKSGSGPYLTSGSSLSPTATGTAPSVEDTLSALGAVLNGGGIAQLQTIVVEFNHTLGGNQGQIRDLLSQISTSLTSLSAHTNDIDSAIAAVGSLSAQLNAGSNIITTGIDAIAPAVTVLSQENGDLNALLTQLTNLSTITNQVVAASGQASINDAHQLLPVVNQLVGVEKQLGPDLTDIANFEAVTPKIAPGNYIQISVAVNTQFNGAPSDVTASAANAQSSAGASTASANRTATGAAAVTALLEGGLP